MPIKAKKIQFLITLSLSILCFLTKPAHAQVVWENPDNPIHEFLSRQAQKGNIEITDFILPLSRRDIAINIAVLRESIQKLSSVEKDELEFYEKEYSEFTENKRDSTTFLKKDAYNRWRFLSVDKDNFVLRGDPILSFETIQGLEKNIFRMSNGAQFWGQAGKNFAFQFLFADITESGTGIDTVKQFTNETGIIRTANVNRDARTLNYSNFRGSVSYSWNNGSVSLGNDQLQWGYGENGKPIMSDKAPAYPFIRLDYQPLKWLRFHYAHSWLHSGIIDSNSSYPKGSNVYGTDRELYVPKFMATHSVDFFPVKGLALSIGESIVYSDRLDIGYLIPIMFFKAYDQYASRYKISTGSNGQFFFQASSRNHLPNTHLYTSLFIDEIRVSEVLNKSKSRNQLGFNAGVSVTDVFVSYLTLGMEYSRINPFVYQNLISAQNYTNQNYLLGDWIGQNADRLTAWIKYNPIPRLNTSIQVNYIRKGDEGDVEDQYYAEPQPNFLHGTVSTQKQMIIEAKYELLNKVVVKGSYLKQAGIIRPMLQPKAVPNEFRLGISYGF